MHRVTDLTVRPDPDVFYRRDDANDPRLGEHVARDPADYARAEVVIVGCPQDMGVARNRGRIGAREAPDHIRRMLYRLTPLGLSHDPARIFDLGDVPVQDSLEANAELHRDIARRILDDGKRLIVLGGGNDIAYPDASALALTARRMIALNVDAHFDVRADTPMNSGTPYRQLIEEGYIDPARFHELGYQPQANAKAYLDYLSAKGAHAVSLAEWRAGGLMPVVDAALADDGDAIFWGFDMDVVRGADAPGVSAVNPLGLTADEFVALWARAGADPRARLIELSEVNPRFDVDGRTARLAAVAIHTCLCFMREA